MDSIRQINQKKNQELGILARLHIIEAEYMIEKLPKIGSLNDKLKEFKDEAYMTELYKKLEEAMSYFLEKVNNLYLFTKCLMY